VKIIKHESEVVTDEVHIIMEYPPGEEWGTHKSPRANRFIVTRDEANSELSTLEIFHTTLKSFQPSLVIIAGLHLMEGQNAKFRKERIDAMLANLLELPASHHIEKKTHCSTFGIGIHWVF